MTRCSLLYIFDGGESMIWCDAYGVCRNPSEFGDDIVLDLVVADEKDDSKDKHVAAIRLDVKSVRSLISTLQYFVSN